MPFSVVVYDAEAAPVESVITPTLIVDADAAPLLAADPPLAVVVDPALPLDGVAVDLPELLQAASAAINATMPAALISALECIPTPWHKDAVGPRRVDVR
jgi:hypothetical protein